MKSDSENHYARNGENSIHERAIRLKTAVKSAGGNTVVSTRAGVPFSTLNAYLGGRDMKASAMIALARACNISLDWLADGVGEMAPCVVVSAQDTTPKNVFDRLSIKFFNAGPSAGLGRSPDEWIAAEEYEVSRNFIRNVFSTGSEKLFIVRVQGSSMEPTLKPGNTMLVDYTEQEYGNGVYIMLFHESLLVKRLTIKDTGTFNVISDNSRYGSFEVPIDRVCWGNAAKDVDLRIWGRIVGCFDMSL